MNFRGVRGDIREEQTVKTKLWLFGDSEHLNFHLFGLLFGSSPYRRGISTTSIYNSFPLSAISKEAAGATTGYVPSNR